MERGTRATTRKRRKLPLGIQTFRKIREQNCYYVDKTAYARRLVEEGGVSKFAKVSLFSGLNNPTDLTLDPACGAICGYTEEDLDTVFAAELPGLDRQQIREWYNGYNWLGAERLYNPFDVLQLFRSRRFRPYWFETGTPAFLVDTLIRQRVSIPSLDGLRGDDDLLSKFDVRDTAPEALLFQTGYLTIRKEETGLLGAPLYRLGYPNHSPRAASKRARRVVPKWRGEYECLYRRNQVR